MLDPDPEPEEPDLRGERDLRILERRLEPDERVPPRGFECLLGNFSALLSNIERPLPSFEWEDGVFAVGCGVREPWTLLFVEEAPVAAALFGVSEVLM